MRKRPEPPEERGFYEPYAEFAKTVRTWFIAFGAGVPVLFLSNHEMWDRLEKAHQVVPFVLCYLAGITGQVAVALVYRTAMWYLYLEEIKVLSSDSSKYRVSAWFSQCYWLEAVVDLLTLLLFSIATFKVLRVMGL